MVIRSSIDNILIATNGTNGQPGAPGTSSYIHIKYSDDGGQTFTSNSGETIGAYIGIYRDFTEADSNNVADYKWKKIEGEDGAPAYTIMLSNENFSISTDTSYVPIHTQSFTCNVTVLKGSDPADFTITASVDTENDIVTRVNGHTVSITVAPAEALSSSQGVITLTIDTTDGQTFTKDITWSTAIQGRDGQSGAKGDVGDNGRSIVSITEYFLLSDIEDSSQITFPEKNDKHGWTTVGEALIWSKAKPVLWHCTEVVYENPDGTQDYEYIDKYPDTGWKAADLVQANLTDFQQGVDNVIDRDNQSIRQAVWENTYTYKPKTDSQGNYMYDDEGKIIPDKDSKTTMSEYMAESIVDREGIKNRVSETEADIDGLETKTSEVEQKADKISWVIKEDESTVSSLVLTNQALTAMTNQFVVKDPEGNATIIEGGKINANSITADMITVNDLIGDHGWINLKDGKFYYGDNATFDNATNAISWNGTKLQIKADDFLLSSGKNIFDEIEAIETWFYPTAPTTSNEPASNWTTDNLKEMHLRDIYFDTNSGKSYRWAKEGTTYKWVEIEDKELSAVAGRLATAETNIQANSEAITERATKTEIANKYETKEDAASKLSEAKQDAKDKADAAENNAKQDTATKLESYYTKTETNTEIEKTAKSITSKVSEIETRTAGNYAISSTAGSEPAKVATIIPAVENWVLYDGAVINVKFTNVNTSSSPTLNINGTGSLNIKNYNGNDLSEDEYTWDAGATLSFVYDGANWRIQDSTELTNIKKNQTQIEQTATSITSLAEGGDTYTKPDGTMGTNTLKSLIAQTATSIESVVVGNDTYTKPDGTTGTNTLKSMIDQTADSIISLVEGNETYMTPDGTTAENKLTTMISQNAGQIELKANSSDVYTKTETDELIDDTEKYADDAVESFSSQFTLTPSEISSEVTALKNGSEISSRINQTANNVKIKASKVEIDGAAIFNNTAFREAADDVYDAKGAAEEAISNLEIGGRNLLLDTNVSSLNKVSSKVNRYWSNADTLSDDGGAEFVEITNPPTNGIKYGIQLSSVGNGTKSHALAFYKASLADRFQFEVGQTYTLSCYVKHISGSDNNVFINIGSRTAMGIGDYGTFSVTAESDSWMKISWTFKPAFSSNGRSIDGSDDNAGNVVIAKTEEVYSIDDNNGNVTVYTIPKKLLTITRNTENDSVTLSKSTPFEITSEDGVVTILGDSIIVKNNENGVVTLESGSLQNALIVSDDGEGNVVILKEASDEDPSDDSRIIYFGMDYSNECTVQMCGFKLEKGNFSTDWTAAPEDTNQQIAEVRDTISGANSREQLIYISEPMGTISVSENNIWVTDATGDQNVWTIKRPEYSKDYPVLFVATQRQTVLQFGGEDCMCTPPMIDDTTTVIDGGNIITGSITAAQIAAGTITANEINVGDLFGQNITATGIISGLTLQGSKGYFTQGFDINIVYDETGKIIDNEYDESAWNVRYFSISRDKVMIGGREPNQIDSEGGIVEGIMRGFYFKQNPPGTMASFNTRTGLEASYISLNAEESLELHTNTNSLYLNPSGDITINSLSKVNITSPQTIIEGLNNESSSAMIHSPISSTIYLDTTVDVTWSQDNDPSLDWEYDEASIYDGYYWENTINNKIYRGVWDDEEGGFSWVEVTSQRKAAFTVSSAGNTGLYDVSNGNWIIESYNSNQNVEIPHPLTVTGALTASNNLSVAGKFTAPKSIVHGTITITPDAANTPKYQPVTWATMAGVPHVVASAVTTVPGTEVVGVGASNITASGCRIYVTRTNTTATVVHYIAIY